ncbi:hypothetical protein QWZ08_06995 [Ferruginibacter paludis]|uniref:hypothetical protein n=1 Tax=Ferruginibacter paludis TaxID=1310417 RepID=UPI0025B2DF14|nr:hypothetical protein [Ferruginibacter paludis]MDN3655363.1 hypothetical protein [Ferruginibacter paludis]
MFKLLLSSILMVTVNFQLVLNTSAIDFKNQNQPTYQYMAVCTDGDGALCPWVDTQEAANKYGKDHEVTTKGHRWRIDTREKPKLKQDSTIIIK